LNSNELRKKHESIPSSQDSDFIEKSHPPRDQEIVSPKHNFDCGKQLKRMRRNSLGDINEESSFKNRPSERRISEYGSNNKVN
jgi:hypothetical protein